MKLESFNPWKGDFFDNPYPHFDKLRANEPVHWSEAFDGWVITSYELVKEVAMSSVFSSDKLNLLFNRLSPEQQKAMSPILENMRYWAIMLDGDDHKRIRTVLNKTFTTSFSESMRRRIEEICDELIAEMAKKDEFDLVTDFAYPFPATLIAWILGVPDDKVDWFKAVSGDLSQVFNLASNPDPECAKRCLVAAVEITEFLKKLLATPELLLEGSLAKSLFDSGLSEKEIISTLTLMLVAGHETTTQLIVNGIYTLLRHPNEKEKLMMDFSLIDSAVEEILRFESPVQNLARVATADYILGGVTIKKGQKVVPFINAANRDPQVFDHPSEFRIDRSPNKHLSFGFGKHLCTGAYLARMEGAISLEKLLKAFPHLRFAQKDQVVSWQKHVAFRQMESLILKA
ncbi:cytochrome P450 [Lentisphaera profundi]|uniref:Cytochrome P450 n=1 Tax=Lentisphaera profundi TaxID=1658616 RepID=A0ABY7VWA9_9BACT|nr:cytochrome P450 [Lentisphaera profundi]WDE98059.1 cytochrome P450 [Lentisphaera profundi]